MDMPINEAEKKKVVVPRLPLRELQEREEEEKFKAAQLSVEKTKHHRKNKKSKTFCCTFR